VKYILDIGGLGLTVIIGLNQAPRPKSNQGMLISRVYLGFPLWKKLRVETGNDFDKDNGFC